MTLDRGTVILVELDPTGAYFLGLDVSSTSLAAVLIDFGASVVRRDLVIKRANGQCQDPDHKGDRRGHRLVADHILERQDRPDLALDLDNGRGVCWSCHGRKSASERAKRMRASTHGGRR